MHVLQSLNSRGIGAHNSSDEASRNEPFCKPNGWEALRLHLIITNLYPFVEVHYCLEKEAIREAGSFGFDRSVPSARGFELRL